jgi:hypothetical protein
MTKARWLAKTNLTFPRASFINACGVSEEEERNG